MTNNKELLELAAKAAGNTLPIGTPNYFDETENDLMWNPLTDDGDALRLAVKLNLSMDLFANFIIVGYLPNNNDADQLDEPTGNDPYAATRRAIVRAAAEIGKEMK